VAPTDGRALDLYLRARQAFRLGGRDNVLAAIALYEQALAIAPNDPTILAAYAQAELRRFTFDPEASGSLAAERKGREAAEKALTLAPHLGEARAALANLQWVLGDPIACARALREAIRVAPSSTDVNELYGRLLLEAGEPQRGLTILTAAAALEPGMGFLAGDLIAGDLVRGRALMGDWSMFEAALEGAVTDARTTTLHVSLARLCMWRRDAAAAAVLRKLAETRRFPFQEQALRLLDNMDPVGLQSFLEGQPAVLGSVVGRARRRPAFFRQLVAEACAFGGDNDGVVRAISEAEGLGLVDLTWVDRCPLFDAMRALPAFVAVRDTIATRARATLDALEWRDAAQGTAASS
jgi:serine/threonine-protein kinase